MNKQLNINNYEHKHKQLNKSYLIFTKFSQVLYVVILEKYFGFSKSPSIHFESQQEESAIIP